jgi:hypothetical protein
MPFSRGHDRRVLKSCVCFRSGEAVLFCTVYAYYTYKDFGLGV